MEFLGSGASADNSLRSAAEALKGTLASDGKRLEIRHFCFAACGSSIRQEVFAGPKSLDAPEPSEITGSCYRMLLHGKREDPSSGASIAGGDRSWI
jgi:hypothetical protein